MATKKVKKKTTFDDKKLFTWLRSALRSASRRYPTLYEALAAAKEPYLGDNPRQKFQYRCAMCHGAFSGKEVSIDHIIDCGSLQSWEDLQGFAQRLFCGVSGLQILCSSCHDCKTYSAKNNVSMEEAKLQKSVIALIKSKSSSELLAFLKEHNYTDASVSNAAKRKAAVTEILSKEKYGN